MSRQLTGGAAAGPAPAARPVAPSAGCPAAVPLWLLPGLRSPPRLRGQGCIHLHPSQPNGQAGRPCGSVTHQHRVAGQGGAGAAAGQHTSISSTLKASQPVSSPTVAHTHPRVAWRQSSGTPAAEPAGPCPPLPGQTGAWAPPAGCDPGIDPNPSAAQTPRGSGRHCGAGGRGVWSGAGVWHLGTNVRS
jgi:hypothetical protein